MANSKPRASGLISFSVLALLTLSMSGCGSSPATHSTEEDAAPVAAAVPAPLAAEPTVEPLLKYPVPDGSAEELAAFLSEMAQRSPTGDSPEEETKDLADIMMSRVHASNQIMSLPDAESIFSIVACEAKLESLRVLALIGHGNEADFVSFADELIGSDDPDVAQLGRIGRLQQQLDEARTLGTVDTEALLSSVSEIALRAGHSEHPDLRALYVISETSEVLQQIDKVDAAIRALQHAAELLKDPPPTESVLSLSTRFAREFEAVGQIDAARAIYEMIRVKFSGHESERLREIAGQTLSSAAKRYEQLGQPLQLTGETVGGESPDELSKESSDAAVIEDTSNDATSARQSGAVEEDPNAASTNSTESDDDSKDVSDESSANEAKPVESESQLETAAAAAQKVEDKTDEEIDSLAEVAERNPYAPDEGMSIIELVEFILEMQDKSRSIQRRDGFVAGIIEAADRVLTADTKDRYQVLAALAKFKYLHRDASRGDDEAEEALRRMMQEFAADTRPEIAAEVAFLAAEQDALAGKGKPAAEATKHIDAAISFFAQSPEDLGPKHLRMASTTVGLINDLEDSQKREDYFQQLAEHLVKSGDKQVSRYGKRIAGTPSDGPNKLVGKPLKLNGETVEGNPFDWQAYRGRVVLVDFWATWCGPCRAMMPEIEALYNAQRDRGFDVVGISLDEDLDQLADFLAEHEIPWTLLAGEETANLAAEYGIRGIPLLIVVDAEGKVVTTGHKLEALLDPIQNLLSELDK